MYKNSLKKIIGTVISLILIVTMTTALDINKYVEKSEILRDVSQDYIVQLSFDKPLNKASITRWNVTVRDEQLRLVAVNIRLEDDNTILEVIPIEPYEEGKEYTFNAKRTLRYRNGDNIEKNIVKKFTIRDEGKSLPTVGSQAELKSILKQIANNNPINNIYRDGPVSFGTEDSANKSSDVGTGQEYSDTNIQVAGVDEADIVKTDGEYIYQLSYNDIVISKVFPVEEMSVLKRIELKEYNIYPRELYLDNKYLVLMGTTNNTNIPRDTFIGDMGFAPPYYMSEAAKILVFDIEDKDNITMFREIELEGYYLSSRKIDSKLYLITNKYINYYRYFNNEEDVETPSYKDSVLGDETINISCETIKYFPDSVDANYMVVAGIDLDNPKEGAVVSTYLGAGQNLYVSTDSMYIATQRYKYSKTPVIYDSAELKIKGEKSYSQITEIYKFNINGTQLDYVAKSEVPGSILNQFSMDEHEDTFRIATTVGNIWGFGNDISKNNLYVLDANMNQVGAIEDIASGERIYSVRFMGDRAYMVTFKKVDPLFVIDLKDAENPKILGALKIPGYSDYLHPYDENHIIGFGKDTIEVVNKDDKGTPISSSAYYLGMKIAVFDVTDVNNPIEKYVEKIGDRGTTSELLNNHKALMFAKNKNLMAFPVTLMEVKDNEKSNSNNIPQYGQFTFQGAYVYNIDLEKGFSLKSTITHLSDEDYLKQGMYWNQNEKSVNRILYIDNNLYTISQGIIKAHDINSMDEQSILQLK